MLEKLRTEATRVTLSLASYDGDKQVPVSMKAGMCLPQANQFVYAAAHVTNHSGKFTHTPCTRIAVLIQLQTRHSLSS